VKVYLAVEEQYFDYADLGSPLAINVPLGITNNEDADLYFKALLESPPEGYSDYEKALGAVSAGSTKKALFTFSRDKPAAETVDELFLRLIAYTDPDYATPYGSLTAKIRLHLIDHDDPSWDIIDHDDFNDQTYQGWGACAGSPDFGLGTGYGISTNYDYWDDHYISGPYALFNYRGTSGSDYLGKDFSVPSGYKEAVLVLHIWRNTDRIAVKVGDKLLVPAGQGYPTGRWIRTCCSIPTGATTRAGIGGSLVSGDDRFWLDEVFCIAR